jgi:Na+/melibiose symporter-like transporter
MVRWRRPWTRLDLTRAEWTRLAGMAAFIAALHIGPLASLGGLDLNYVGYAIVALFVVTWIIALMIWRFGRIEERWKAASAPAAPLESVAAASPDGLSHGD